MFKSIPKCIEILYCFVTSIFNRLVTIFKLLVSKNSFVCLTIVVIDFFELHFTVSNYSKCHA